jgi:N6-adenosine-specific RNA methylase IME4
MAKYQIIYADPPWRFKNWSIKELAVRGKKWAKKNGRSPYNVMNNEDIYDLPVQNISDKNCILFLWATYPKLPEALETIRRWGFEYKTVAFTWVKQNRVSDGFHFGLGYWTRGNPELCLLATRGNIKRQSRFVANLQISHLRDHSRKPDEIRNKIVELVGDLPRIELFAREKVEGWDAIGNDIDGMDIRDSILRVAAL